MLVVLILGAIGLTDWGQWGGAQRNFSSDTRISGVDVDSPVKEVWSTSVAPANSGLVVVNDRVFTQCRIAAGAEAVVALSSRTGELKWMTQYTTEFEASLDLEFGAGPHSTPCFYRDSIFAIGSTGELVALDAMTGKLVWSRKLWVDFPATRLERGFAASPVCWRDSVIVSIGGAGCAVVALDIETGATNWGTGSFEGAYTSPSLVTIDGTPQLVTLFAETLVSIDPMSGVMLWSTPCPVNNTAHVCSPCYLGSGKILVCSSEESRMLQVRNIGDAWAVTELWATKAMTPQVGNVVSLGGVLVGPSSGSSVALLSVIDQESGKLLDKKRLCGPGFLLRAEDGIITLSDRGELAICEVREQAVVVLHRDMRFLSGRAWAAPALVGSSLFVRDRNGVRRVDFNFNR